MDATDEVVRRWFCGEVLPLEPALMRFLRRNWRTRSELLDLRQEIYVRACEAARAQIPLNAKAFVFAIARNHLIDRARRARIVSFELVADLEALPMLVETLTPERQLSARQDLMRLGAGLAMLPPRCREVITLRRVHGLSQKETARRLGVTLSAVEQQTTKGMRALIDHMLGRSRPHDPDEAGDGLTEAEEAQ